MTIYSKKAKTYSESHSIMCVICDGVDVSTVVYLDCSGCETVHELPETLSRVRILNVSMTTSLTTIPYYDTLTDLYCSDSAIETIPSFPFLRKLIANGSKLREVPGDLYCLEGMNLNETTIDRIPSSLISLHWLSAKRTMIDTVPGELESLTWLNVKGSSIHKLPASMKSLQYLNCGDSDVSDINLIGYRMLQTLYCRGCPIDPFTIENPSGVAITTT